MSEYNNIDIVKTTRSNLDIEPKVKRGRKPKDTSTNVKVDIPNAKRGRKPKVIKSEEDNIEEVVQEEKELIRPIKINTSLKDIKFIYHISDIHIQLYKRHKEYEIIFEKLYDYLQKQIKESCEQIIVITGDILHSKSDLSPECIQLTYNFIKKLASIMPLVMIAGNHDINMNNHDRLDSLTPIIGDLPLSYPIYYLLDSGIYEIGNILFYHASVFDYKIIKPIHVQYQNKKHSKHFKHIMLYHGRVNGAVLYNGMVLNDDDKNTTITPSTFSTFDITLLGDIHKHQFMTPSIAYAGSLIQQNLGEDIENHGLIKWDLSTNTGSFFPIYNDWSYVTINIDNKIANIDESQLTKNIRVRILYKNTPESYLYEYITMLKMNHNVLDYSWQNNENVIYSTSTMSNIIESNTTQVSNALLIDITSVDVQNKYITEYLKDNCNQLEIAEDHLDKICNEISIMNANQNILLKETNKQYNNNNFNGHYKLKRLEFSNLFSFSNNNIINFTEFKGIVGIIAPNHLGKSAIIDIIIYTLFDEFTRKGSIRDIININKDNFNIKMDIGIGQWTYTIKKWGIRSKTSVNVKVEFYRVNDVNKVCECLDEDTILKTKERIREYFGCYEDIIHTSFSIQHDNSCFIDASNIKRKDELERIMRFEILKKLYELANQKYNKDKSIYEHIKKKINNDDIINIKKAKIKSENTLIIIKEDRIYAKEKIKNIHNAILDNTSKLHTECINEKYNDEQTILDNINNITSQITTLQNNIHSHINVSTQQNLDKIIKDMNMKIKKIDESNNKLYRQHKPISNLDRDLSALLTQYTDDNIRIDNIIKELEFDFDRLESIELQIENNNKHILDLERQILPKELLTYIEQPIANLDNQYNQVFKKFISDVLHKKVNDISNVFDDIYNMESYLEYVKFAKRYFITTELQKYTYDTIQQDILIYEKENKKLVDDLTRIKNLQKQYNQLISKKEQNNIKIEQIECDLENMINNKKIDDMIENNNISRNECVTILDNVNTVKTYLLQIAKLELELSIQNGIRDKIILYRDQIAYNKPILETIEHLNEELRDFEEVLELIEIQYTNETSNIVKYTALLDQIKNDIKEGKEIEHRMQINDYYRIALKQLPYILLSKIQPILEKKVNDLLSITTDFTVKFDMSDSKIDIYLDRSFYKDKLRNIIINNASGFERFMASLAIRLALLDLSNLPKINFIAIDEGWSSFDTDNINNVSIILDYLTTKFDFVLTISHLVQIKQHCDMQISLIKDDTGYSKIKCK